MHANVSAAVPSVRKWEGLKGKAVFFPGGVHIDHWLAPQGRELLEDPSPSKLRPPEKRQGEDA